MTAGQIAVALGAARCSGGWWRAVCPVHGSRTGRSAALALRDGERGLIVRCFADCDPRDVQAELRRRGLLGGDSAGRGYRPSAMPIRTGGRDDADAARRIAVARRIWNAAQDARGSPVARYLARRDITVPPPPSLRWEPRCWHCETRTELPAMVARIDGPDGTLWGVHRTWLRRDAAGIWRRLDRAMLGRAAGGAVRLAPAGEMLLVGEGVETVLAGIQATGLSGWAAQSTSGLAALILPPEVRHVIILADNDTSGAGERFAKAAAIRQRAEGKQVSIYISPRVGEDAADLISSIAASEVRDAA